MSESIYTVTTPRLTFETANAELAERFGRAGHKVTARTVKGAEGGSQ